jgi:hypothetical protein
VPRLAVLLAAALLLPSLAQAQLGSPAAPPPLQPAKPQPKHIDIQTFELKPDLPAATRARKASKLVYVMGANKIWTSGANRTIEVIAGQQNLAPTAHSLAFVGGIQDDAALYSFGGYAQTRFARATGWDKVLRAVGRI